MTIRCQHIHAFTRGLDLDIDAAAAVTPPSRNGRTEGVNTKTRMIKRQMHGRAGFTFLRGQPRAFSPRDSDA